MCGISILLSKEIKSNFIKFVKSDIKKMNDRGPDYQKIKILNDHVIAGHTRLAINGLTRDFDQPYTRDNEHFLIFNGEIYNFRDTDKLNKSDTKFLYDNLKAANGNIKVIKEFLRSCDAVWAFAFVSSDYIILSRDIFGEKPMYRHSSPNNQFTYFSSLEKSNGQEVCNSEQFPANSITKIFFKDLDNEYSECIFNYKETINIRKNDGFQSGFESHLEASIKKRIDCDVPVACTLSGGLDSSVIAVLANKFSKGDVTFFTSVPSIGKSELQYAKYVADKLDKKLEIFEYDIEMYFKSLNKNLNIFPQNINSPSSIIHLMLMDKIKNAGYKVCLDGQGADEYLGGYRFQTVEWLLYKFIKTFNLSYLYKLLTLLLREKQFSLYYYVIKKIVTRNIKNQESIIEHCLFVSPLPSLLSYTDFVSMKNSIEVRTPFLNLDLINFTRTNRSFTFDYPITKGVLRNILDKNGLSLISNRIDKIGYELPWVELCRFIRSKEGRKHMPKFNLNKIIQERIILRYVVFRIALYFMPKIAIYSHLKLSRVLGFVA